MSLSPMDTTRVCGQYNSNLFWKGELLINLPYLCLSKKLWTCLPPMPNTANQRWKKSGTRELSSQKKFWFWTFRRKKFGVKKKRRKKEKGNERKEKFSAKNDVIKTICFNFQRKISFKNERKFLIKWKKIFLKVKDNFRLVSKKFFSEDQR